MRTPRKTKLIPGTWYALVRGPKALPVVFPSRRDALDNRDPDEYLVRVRIEEATQPTKAKSR